MVIVVQREPITEFERSSDEVRMQTYTPGEARPEAMADVPGVCALPLTRAVVQYRGEQEIDRPGGWIRDIGLGVVVEGRYAAEAEVIDLGSAELRRLDLSGELVVLDWVHEPTLEHLSALAGEAARTGDRMALERFCTRVGLQILERTGFGPLTRPSLLRVGFRDICRDLDLHDGTSVRIDTGGGRLVRIHLDYDDNLLVFRTPVDPSDDVLERALAAAFPEVELRRIVPAHPAASGGYLLRLALPLDLGELRAQMELIRRGLLALFARFEPGRHQTMLEMMITFGARATLARLRDRPIGSVSRRVDVRAPAPRPEASRPEAPPLTAAQGTVH